MMEGVGESRNRSFNSAEIGEIGEMMIHPVLRRFQHPRISKVLNWVESPETTKILGPQKKWSCVFVWHHFNGMIHEPTPWLVPEIDGCHPVFPFEILDTWFTGTIWYIFGE